MAIGPSIYREEYKNYSNDELERELKKLQEYLCSDELKKERQEEIEKGIDDNNCVTNIETAINVIKDLISSNNVKNHNTAESKAEITLKNLIKENSLDPFWADCFTNFFNQINKTEDEKLEFFKKVLSNKELFNNFSKDILKTSNKDELFEKYKMDLNMTNNKMTDEELKKIIEEVIGNNDPFWNETVFNIVKKIIDLPEGTETTISKLFGDTVSSYNKFMFNIDKTVTKVCEKINIKLDRSKYNGAVVGLPFNTPFKKCYISNKNNVVGENKLKTYITREIINLAEITIVANKFLKENEIVESIMHDSSNCEYHFKFLNEERNSVHDWIMNLKEEGATEMYIDFAPPKNICTVAYTNATPAGIICKYNNGKVTSWSKTWRIDNETKKVIILYQERLCETNYFNTNFVNNFESNFNYFKAILKKIKEFSETLGCKEWAEYFNNVFELEKIENAKVFIPTKVLYKIIPDKNLCAYAMAIQAYPFGGMGSWCDNAYMIAKEKNLEAEYEKISKELFNEIMGMIAYATNNI